MKGAPVAPLIGFLLLCAVASRFLLGDSDDDSVALKNPTAPEKANLVAAKTAPDPTQESELAEPSKPERAGLRHSPPDSESETSVPEKSGWYEGDEKIRD